MTAQQTQGSGCLRWIIASEYYDGAMAGIGERSTDGATVWFRTVAWDDEQWQRVFAIAAVEPPLGQSLIRELEKVEKRQSPFWLPGPSSATPEAQVAWDAIVDAALRADRWWLVEAHDLLEASTERLATPSEAGPLTAALRAGSVLTLPGPVLIDDFMRQIQSHAG